VRRSKQPINYEETCLPKSNRHFKLNGNLTSVPRASRIYPGAQLLRLTTEWVMWIGLLLETLIGFSEILLDLSELVRELPTDLEETFPV